MIRERVRNAKFGASTWLRIKKHIGAHGRVIRYDTSNRRDEITIPYDYYEELVMGGSRGN